MKKAMFLIVIGIIVVLGIYTPIGEKILDKTRNVAADSNPPPVFQGVWSNTSSEMMAIELFIGGSYSISATLLEFSGNEYRLTAVQGTFGMGRTEISKGTFRVYSKIQTIELIDEFDDVFYRNKYVLSETDDQDILKLKDEENSVLTFYKSKDERVP